MKSLVVLSTSLAAAGLLVAIASHANAAPAAPPAVAPAAAPVRPSTQAVSTRFGITTSFDTHGNTVETRIPASAVRQVAIEPARTKRALAELGRLPIVMADAAKAGYAVHSKVVEAVNGRAEALTKANEIAQRRENGDEVHASLFQPPKGAADEAGRNPPAGPHGGEIPNLARAIVRAEVTPREAKQATEGLVIHTGGIAEDHSRELAFAQGQVTKLNKDPSANAEARGAAETRLATAKSRFEQAAADKLRAVQLHAEVTKLTAEQQTSK